MINLQSSRGGRTEGRSGVTGLVCTVSLTGAGLRAMEGPFLSMVTPAKRSLEGEVASASATADGPGPGPGRANGSSKRRTKPPPPPIPVPAGHSVFRLLCRVPIIGGVIGRSGSIISLLRQETGAKIRVEEAVPSCDERVILLVAPESPKKKIRLAPEDEEVDVSAAQEALLRVFDRALEVEAETEGATALDKPVSCRLLAATSQVGSVMGKGGKNIEKIRKESGAKIRVLPVEQLPACAVSDDELIQIMGDAMAVKKALVAVSRCLGDGPSDKTQIVNRAQRAVPQSTLPDAHMEFLSHRSSLLPPAPGSSTDFASSGHLVLAGVDRTSMLDQNKNLLEVSFRLLCSNDKVGGVIGKGGTIVRVLQNETGASISVGASVAESEERVITISASESPELTFSRAQNAVLRVFRRSVEAGIEKGVESGLDKDALVTARLLVPTNQIGCLMGKGGAIIQEMWRLSGANIRIIGDSQIPKCAYDNEEVVQISGEFGNVQNALFCVTSRLRDNLLPAKVLNGSGMGAYASSHPEITSYGKVGPTSPRFYPSGGLSHNLDRQSTLAHSMDHLGLSNSIDRPASPRLWASQRVAGGNPRAIPDTGSGLITIRGGIKLGRSKPAIVTNTTVDILVPEGVFWLVYGDNGSNLSRIRQISGATVVVHDPHPGKSDGRVIISGTPDQTQAAQSLLQAFILSGQPSAAPHS